VVPRRPDIPGPPNKGVKQTSAAQSKLVAPFAAYAQC
jgi:hypothetical protein